MSNNIRCKDCENEIKERCKLNNCSIGSDKKGNCYKFKDKEKVK